MGMLRASAIANGIEHLDLRALADSAISSGVAGSIATLSLVDASLANDVPGAAAARTAVAATLGAEAVSETAAVIGNFEMMNRIADGAGTPVSARAREVITDELEELGLGHIAHTWGS